VKVVKAPQVEKAVEAVDMAEAAAESTLSSCLQET
jgi:hypothetical protein